MKHQGMRRHLVDLLRNQGINNEAVLDAINTIPRHFFLDPIFDKQAYSNEAFQIGAGQTISQPYTVAFQTELLNLKKGDKVLEIGTGSAYQTCVLCHLGAKVYSIERQKELFVKAQEMIKIFKYTPRLSYGDGYKGLPSFAPFDKVLITCGAPEIPQELIKQLKIGGVMVAPVGSGKIQIMKRITKISDTEVKIEDFGHFSFVPMLEDKSR